MCAKQIRQWSSAAGTACVLAVGWLWARGTFGGDFERPLVGGYRVFGATGMVTIVAPDGSVVVGNHVDGVRVRSSLIVGHVADDDSGAAWLSGEPGYFWLDKRTGRRHMGLDVRAWSAELASLGLSPAPALRSPRWFP